MDGLAEREREREKDTTPLTTVSPRLASGWTDARLGLLPPNMFRMPSQQPMMQLTAPSECDAGVLLLSVAAHPPVEHDVSFFSIEDKLERSRTRD